MLSAGSDFANPSSQKVEGTECPYCVIPCPPVPAEGRPSGSSPPAAPRPPSRRGGLLSPLNPHKHLSPNEKERTQDFTAAVVPGTRHRVRTCPVELRKPPIYLEVKGRYSPFLRFTTTKLNCYEDPYLTAKFCAFMFVNKAIVNVCTYRVRHKDLPIRTLYPVTSFFRLEAPNFTLCVLKMCFIISRKLRRSLLLLSLAMSVQANFNPRTAGGLSHLRTAGGGGGADDGPPRELENQER